MTLDPRGLGPGPPEVASNGVQALAAAHFDDDVGRRFVDYTAGLGYLVPFLDEEAAREATYCPVLGQGHLDPAGTAAVTALTQDFERFRRGDVKSWSTALTSSFASRLSVR